MHDQHANTIFKYLDLFGDNVCLYYKIEIKYFNIFK
jgi:hypothetical protein